jgi:shikimate dehydrogenase
MIRGAVLGGDVSKSRSPAIHAASFRDIRIKGAYGAFSVDQEEFEPLVRRLGNEGYRYLNVTIPHKQAAAAIADRRSPFVRATGAANTLIFQRSGRRLSIRAENTDGYGLLTALSDLGVTSVRGRTIVMVGSGGAAAGAMFALVRAGARVRLVARRPGPARALRQRLPSAQRTRVTLSSWTPRKLAAALKGADVLVSAVPAAAWQGTDARAGLALLARSAAVVEMAYGGATPLAAAVRPLCARYQDGLPMLVHQAACAVELAVGKKPRSAPLLRAARG